MSRLQVGGYAVIIHAINESNIGRVVKLIEFVGDNCISRNWGKCPCGSSRSPIVSDKEGYNLIHCFACGANKYIHEDY